MGHTLSHNDPCSGKLRADGKILSRRLEGRTQEHYLMATKSSLISGVFSFLSALASI